MKEKKDHSTLKGSGLVNKLPAVLLAEGQRCARRVIVSRTEGGGGGGGGDRGGRGGSVSIWGLGICNRDTLEMLLRVKE